MKKKSKRRIIIIGILATLLVLGYVGFNNLRNTAKKNLVALCHDRQSRKGRPHHLQFLPKVRSSRQTRPNIPSSVPCLTISSTWAIRSTTETDLGKYVNAYGSTKLVESKVSGIVTQIPTSFNTLWVISSAEKLEMSVQISEKRYF